MQRLDTKLLVLLAFFSLLLPYSVYSQIEKDSVQLKLETIKNPIQQISYLHHKSNQIWDQDTVKAFSYLNTAIEIGEQNNYYKQLGNSYRFKGNIFYQYGLGIQMKDNYLKSYEYYTLAEDSLGLAKISNNIGIYYDEWVNDYNKALLYLERSLKLKEELNVDSKTLATTYFNLGSVHLHLNSYIKSLHYFYKSLELMESLGLRKEVADINNRIARVYLSIDEYEKSRKYVDIAIRINSEYSYNEQLAKDYLLLGKMFSCLNNIDSSLYNLRKTEVIYSKSLNLLGLARVYNSYIDLYTKTGDFEKVFKYGFLAEEIFTKSGALNELSQIYSSLGIAYYKTKNLPKSEEFLLKSLKISNKYSFLEISKNNYEYLAKINFDRNDYEDAYLFHESHSEIKDTLFSLKKAQIAADMEDKYAINKKEIELNLLAQEKQKVEFERDRNITVSNYLKLIIVLVLIVLSLIFYLYYSNKRLNDKLEDLVEERTKELKESNKLLANSKKNEEDVNRIKSDLLKNISESLKTPISEIQSLLRILKDENEDNYELYEQLELISASTFRLNAIINSVTELYNIEERKKTVRHDVFDLNSLIRSIITNHNSQAESRDLLLDFSANGKPILFNLDRELMNNAFDHLVKTIVDYANKGVVKIDVVDYEDSKAIEVYSSHFSINQKIFNQDLSTNSGSINDNTKQQLDRMFISLFVTKKMVEKMDGNIRWEPANDGDGIKFIISFPSAVVS